MKSFTASIAFALMASLHLSGASPAPIPQSNSAAIQVSVSYDPKYDVSGTSLNTVTCSDGENGLIRKGFSTFGSLPTFPRIGGAPTVEGWNSVNCGKCYSLHYKSATVDKTIKVLAIDKSSGFNIGEQAMNLLTDNQAVALGRVTATYSLLADSECGM